MEVKECKNHVKCELGACRNRASKQIEFDRVGIRARIYACDKCLNELYAAIGATVVPRSVETAKKSDKRGKSDKGGN